MKKKIPVILKYPFYFALFAVYPVLALVAYNNAEIRPVEALRSIFISFVAALILFASFWLLFKSKQRAALLVTFLWLLFFSYGHVFNLIGDQWDTPDLTAWLAGVWLLLGSVATTVLARKKTRVRKAAPYLNIIGLVLIVASLVQLISWKPAWTGKTAAEFAEVQEVNIPEEQPLPDIYYIIIDSYGRSDLLERSFQFDNSGFIKSIRETGFYVAECSQSNYNRTEVSLASSLNMDYLQNLDDAFQPPNTGRRILWDSISQSAVRAVLESAGYKTIAFATGFAWSEIADADVYLSPSVINTRLTSFEILLLRTTPLRHLEDAGRINMDAIEGQRFHNRTELIFNNIERISRMPGPKFVFIHILPPHPPFIYAPDGSWTDPAEFFNDEHLYTSTTYTQGYRNQLAYINGKVETAIQTILAESKEAPVIILQGDHAPWLQRGSGKFMILNAYYLPGKNDLLYPSISPVNTFRLILDTYLGAGYPLLKDISYYSPTPDIYNFSEVVNPCLEK